MNKTSRKRLILLGAVIIAVLILDQWLKVYVKSNFYPGESKALLGNWLVLEYIENQGMAFGQSFGSSSWHKLALSLFRLGAIVMICIYLVRQIKVSKRFDFLVAVSLVVAGATGNLLDSMFYDYLFSFDPCMIFNHLDGSGIVAKCEFWGEVEVREHGFLYGNVVDMFKFDAQWPQSLPYLGGRDVFPAIWNLADGSITLGVIYILITQTSFFKRK